MKRSTAALVIVVIAALGLICLALAGPSMSTQPAPSPSPSVSATPTPSPASAATVHWAMHWQRDARRAREALSRVRACFDAHAPVRVGSAPDRGASEETWERFGRHVRYQCRDWTAKVKAGVARMRHPGGSGAARWWPAALYCGWEPSLKSWFCAIVWRESSARVLAENPSSHCFGLLQIHPCHWAAKGIAWIRDVFNQLRLGWKLYRECGASPWAVG